MAEFRSIKVEKGSGGFGGPLIITPTEKKNKVMFITGGGTEPECLQKIVELSGLTPVNGFKTNCPEEELALVIIDCGGTLRCGIYPKSAFRRSTPIRSANPARWHSSSRKTFMYPASPRHKSLWQTAAPLPHRQRNSRRKKKSNSPRTRRYPKPSLHRRKRALSHASAWAQARLLPPLIRRRVTPFRRLSQRSCRSWHSFPCSSALSTAPDSAMHLHQS